LGKYDPFICLLVTALKVSFKLIILRNQNDGWYEPESKKLGTKIEFIQSTL